MKITNKSRWTDLPILFKDLGFKIGAEIGIERAIYSKTLLENIPDLKLYGIDPWKAYREYREHINQKKLDILYEDAKQRMKPYNFELIRKFSMDAVKDFEDESLDFVFIDANHNYENVLRDITEWEKKVKKGGIVSGHDYIKRKGQDSIYGVVRAVNDYVKTNNINNLEIWRGDKSPTWLWIKH